MSEGVLVVRPLEIEEVAVAAERLPLNRLAQPGGEYLVAWDGSEPLGHAHLDWRSDPPELQDVFVCEPLRRRGIGSALCAAAERHVVKRGGRRIRLEVSEEDRAARALYEKLGYHQTDEPYARRSAISSGCSRIDEAHVPSPEPESRALGRFVVRCSLVRARRQLDELDAKGFAASSGSARRTFSA